MKHKLLIGFLIASPLFFSACYDDEISALKKKIRKLENITGSNEPITINFSTSNGNANVIKTGAYYFKSVSWATSFAGNNGDGTYVIIVERAADVEWRSNVRFSFTYDQLTGQATGANCLLNFVNNDGHDINANFFPGAFIENSVTVYVNHFNIETGKISLTIHATTTTNSENNAYTNRPMTLDLTFDGKLDTFSGGGE